MKWYFIGAGSEYIPLSVVDNKGIQKPSKFTS